MDFCREQACLKGVAARGLCWGHYQRERRAERLGILHTPEARFWAKVQGGDIDTCWIWTGAKSNGYGRLTVNGEAKIAHRVAWEYLRGEIPEGLHIDHLCRNRACVNPWHLEPVTARVNTLRGESTGAKALRRTHCLKGHNYAIHGAHISGRRICRTCRIDYLREYRIKRRQEREQWWTDLLAARDAS